MIRTQADLSAAIKTGASEIEINAAEPLKIANITRPVRLTGEIRPAALATAETPILTISGSSGVSIEGLKVSGVPSGAGFLGRLYVVDSQDISVRNSRFSECYRGAIFERVAGLAIERNDVVTVQSDGFDIVACSQVRIAENLFDDFRPMMRVDGKGDHPDAIQFWTRGQKSACSDVEIVDNVCRGATTEPPQFIFVGEDLGLRHQRIRIARNLLLNGLWNGIYLANADDSEIRDNVLAWQAGVTADSGAQKSVVPRIRTAGSPTAIVQGNSAAAYVWPGQAWNYVPAGNVTGKPSTPAELDAMWQAWLAEHRAPPKPTKDATLAEIGAMIAALNAKWGEFAAG